MRSSADSAPLTLSVPSRLEDVRRLAEFLRAACTAAAIDEMTAFDCELALVEAANNVVEHGYAGVAEGEVSLELTIARDALRMVLSDRGKPVPEGQFDRCKLVPLDAVDGRGTGIIMACVDEIAYESGPQGNRLVLVKQLGG